MKGLEPPRRKALDPKSSAATNYATSAWKSTAKVEKISFKQNEMELPAKFEVFAKIYSSYLLIIS